MHREFLLVNPGSLIEVSGWLTKHVAASETVPSRVAKLLSFFVTGGEFMRELYRSHCESGVMIAQRLGFDARVQEVIRYLWEQWDGRSKSYGLGGDAIPVAARVLHLAQVLEVGHRFGGAEQATRIARERRGKDFDPDLVDAYLSVSQRPDFWEVAGMESVKPAVLDLRPPSPYEVVEDDQIDNMCAVLADFIDIKSPYSWGHSKLVAQTAAGMAQHLGLEDRQVTTLRRAGLVHDLGKVMVPCSALEKQQGFTIDETERIRLHPYYSERLLTRVDSLQELAPLAATHHECCDGSGYHRQLTGDQMTLEQHILAVADRYATLAQPSGRSDQSILDGLQARVGTDCDQLAYEGLVGYLSGGPLAAAPVGVAESPGNLSGREIEVIQQVAKGLRNKEIARSLVISEKTVERHLENIYNKLGVSTRTSAVVYGLQHGLLP